MEYHEKLKQLVKEVNEFLETEFDSTPRDCGGGYLLNWPKYPGGVRVFLQQLGYGILEISESRSVFQVPTSKKKEISNTTRTKVLERDKYRCMLCNSFKALSIDHVKPQKEGGTNDIGNLRTLCKKCNSAKGARKATR